MRAETFQSMRRMSSPGMYSRTSEKAMPRPLNTEWYCPAIRSRTSRSVTISILRIFLSSSRVSMGLRHFDALEQLADDVLRGHLLGLGLVGDDDPVAEHVDADGLDVLGGDVAATAQEGVGPRGHVQIDRGARAGSVLDQIRQLGQAVGLGIAGGVDDVDDVVADLLVYVDLAQHR